jgi:sodium/proline symporter
MIVATFLFSLFAFIAIGAYAVKHKQGETTEDYLLANRSIGPWFTALSAMASNNSGFMYVGFIGAVYASGISAAWVMIGWVFGDYLTWFFIPEGLRRRSAAQDAKTIPTFLGGVANGWLPRGAAALVTLVFLGAYASAQLSAGSKALQVLFGWDYAAGAAIGAVIVLIYCFSGGIRASIWTDVAQSLLMVGAVFLLAIVGVKQAGGFGSLWSQLAAIDPQLVSIRPADPRFGFGLFVLGWFGAGFGVVGQPHIMVRIMASRHPDELRVTRHIYTVWNFLLTVGCVIAALCCRVLLGARTGFDPELALPTLSQELLPPVFVGVIIAGLFAATMSTADSQVLVCSSAITQDLFPGWRDSYAKAKLGTVLVTVAILAIALNAGESVFAMVTMAWSALGASLGPLMIVRAFGWRASAWLATAMIVSGLAAVFVWRFTLGFGDDIFEVLPGMIVGLVVYALGRVLEMKRGDAA